MSYNVPKGFFSAANEMQAQYNKGEIAANTNWPKLEGSAELLDIEAKLVKGKSILDFKLKHRIFGVKDMGVIIPSRSADAKVKAFAQQRILCTLFSAFDFDPQTMTTEQAFIEGKKILSEEGSIPVIYKLREYENESPNNGKIYKNQSIEALTRADDAVADDDEDMAGSFM